MTTQISFTADEALKTQALEKAKIMGITLKAFLIFAMKGFVQNRFSVGLEMIDEEPAVEEMKFQDPEIYKKAEKIARLLK